MPAARRPGRRPTGAAGHATHRLGSGGAGRRLARRLRPRRRPERPARLLGDGPRGRGRGRAAARRFERAIPASSVRVQQLPWTAAHEKLLTAFAGDALPDLCQLGNTWLPEFSALGALEPLDDAAGRPPASPRDDYFAGILDTNVMRRRARRLLGVPWYVDTRLLFYRSDLLRAAGHAQPPQTWAEWRAAMQRRPAARRRPHATARCCRSTSPIRCSRWRCSKDRCSPMATAAAPSRSRRSGARSTSTPACSATAWRRAMSGDADRQRVGRVRARPVRLLRHRPLEHRRVPAPPAARAAGRLGDGAAAGPGRAGRVDRRRLEPRRSSSARRARTRRGS